MEDKEQKLLAINNDLKSIEEQAQKIVVTNEEEKVNVVQFLGRVKERIEKVEYWRKLFVQPLNDHVKLINNEFKMPAEKFKKIEEELKKSLKIYVDEQERKAREEYERKQKEEAERKRKLEEEQRRAEEEAKKAKSESERKRLEEIAKAKEAEAKEEKQIEVAQPEQQTRTEAGLMSIRKVWKFEIIDPEKVPTKYLIIDESAIRKDIVQNGEREIPGVRIFQDTQISMR